MPFGLELGAGLVEGAQLLQRPESQKPQTLVHWVGTGL